MARYPQSVTRFNQANVLIHHIVPFAIHLICTLSLILVIARRRAKVTGGTTTHLFRRHLNEHKELFVPVGFIILSALPQFIISFSLACTDFNQAWQRYSLIAAYFLSFVPETLTFLLYIEPSSSFKQEFSQTFIGLKYYRR